ncbi:hypothetical protein [Desulfocurvus sp.]|jgi:hypothetical protein|uniref:hypothetical protein n=1 Tax=Desulfocurvus sp. TaxID=2871698 RepID=UPI0025B7E0B8|nr:hypothetical protein [Desulfocurvus sp.]MCK9240571.1 hypothetical protein [Desulfocurvus sp.]
MTPRTVKARLNPAQRWVVVVMDVLLLAELTFCMYRASAAPGDMAAGFLRLYLPMLLVTLVAARLALRRLRDPQAPAGTASP